MRYDTSPAVTRVKAEPLFTYRRGGRPDIDVGETDVWALPTFWHTHKVFNARAKGGAVKRDETTTGLWPLWRYQYDEMTGAEK